MAHGEGHHGEAKNQSHSHDHGHSHEHGHGHAHGSSAALENWRNSDLPFFAKSRLALGNTWIKIRKRQSCCGQHGEPGC